jgi:hypothetical protein
MATVSWADILNGELLSSIRSKINTFNTLISTQTNSNTSAIAINTNNIATNTSNIATNTIDISNNTSTLTNIDARIENLENVGLTVLSGSNLPVQSIGTSPVKVSAFDSILIDTGVGTSGSVLNQRATAELDGVFKIRYESFISYASNVTITWQIYKNGLPFGSSLSLAGRGAEVFPLVLISSTELLAGDFIELYATSSATTDLTTKHANGTLEKTYF